MNRLLATQRPAPVTVDLPGARQAEDAERELARHARADGHRCWGYFPSLTGRPGIRADLPACRDFASALPQITVGGRSYRFNFLRLSLRCQSADPAYHLDTDAATALTGDPATLGRRLVGRLLLNLSTTLERSLYYLDLDASEAAVVWEGAYARAAEQMLGAGRAVRAVIPPRTSTIAHGITFVANQVLHSGVDGPCGHFVAAYGYDVETPALARTGRSAPTAVPVARRGPDQSRLADIRRPAPEQPG